MAGAHGLGLLRWCALRPSQLEQMLLTSFDGVGLPENTSVELHDNGEYMLRDNRYFYMHTFIKRGDAEPDKLLLQMCRRLAFLKAKIIEDLNLGEKTFVYKTPEGKITTDEILAIAAGIRRYGKGRLLCVRLQDSSNQPGTVTQIAPGVMVGYLDRLPATLVRGEISYDCWVSICRKTELLGDRDYQNLALAS